MKHKKKDKTFELSEQDIKNSLANMKTFKVSQKLKQATFAYIVTHLLNKQEKKSLAKLFCEIDKDNDGHINKQEMSDAFRTYFGQPIDDDELDKMFNNIDVSESGLIEYTEFMLACIPEKVLLTNENLASVFKIFDDDGSGEITSNEIREVFTNYNCPISRKVAL